MSLSGRAGAKTVLVESDEVELPFGVVATKIRPPAVRDGAVLRTALVHRLRAERSARTVSVVAPGGYGKTTLLAQWAARDDRSFAWVSLDRRDSDPVVLLRHIAAAIATIVPVHPGLLDAPTGAQPSIWTTMVPQVETLIASAKDCVLVLDDLHTVDGNDSHEVLRIVAEHLPAGSALALSSRTECTLSATMRSGASLLEIGIDDLALTRREAELLLRGVGAKLSDAGFAELIEKTEGWAGALYLETLSMKRPITGRERLVDGRFAATGTNDVYVMQYFQSEYLTGLSPERLQFLRRTSVLAKMSAALCDAVIGRKDSLRELEALRRSNLFLLPVNAGEGWWRYHRLFRELLRRQLHETEPELVKELGGRAAEWFLAHDEPESAIEHALSVGDVDQAAHIFERTSFPAAGSSRQHRVETWLAQFDDEALSRHPTIAMEAARLHAVHGSTDKVEICLNAAEGAAVDNPELTGRIATVRAALCRDGVEAMLCDAGSAVASLPETSDWRGSALIAYGVGKMLAGDDDGAYVLFGEAAAHARRVGGDEQLLVATSERLFLADAARDHAASARLAVELSELLDGGAFSATAPAALALTAAARSQLRHGNWDGARALLNRAVELTPCLTDALPWLSVQTRLELARMFVALRDLASARALVAEIDGVFDLRPDLGVLVGQTGALRELLDSLSVMDYGRRSNLTAAEMRLMPFLPTHLSFREIGDRLHLSRNTIKTQAIAVYRKLGVSTRGEAIEEAVRLGLVDDTWLTMKPPVQEHEPARPRAT